MAHCERQCGSGARGCAHFAQDALAELLARVEDDAWTHSKAMDPHRPLYRVAVADEAQRWLYASGATGEVVRDASFTERSWGWLGAWLHWLTIFCGGRVRWRFRGRYKSGSSSPDRKGFARRHHILGLGGGVLALTRVLSGLFSMNPSKMFEAPGTKPDRAPYAGDPQRAEKAGDVGALLRRQLCGGTERQAPVVHERRALREAAARLLPQSRIVEQEWLQRNDADYYSREPHTMTGQRERPLPVLRLRFDDPQSHWVVIDPANGHIVQLSSSRRSAGCLLFCTASICPCS
ncbi:hypothetical protein [Kinneretia aquatilis]|uniref:hypothetical protein n=1 Tax=Kinneretia aquatilis TaxID=2070761 RepID=UPI0014952F4D|nr:hypothetical protein [Paucibacter aquatile]WIV97212.1 hypothetical protein K9V56_019680 [Paucibacter aquatile]